MTLPELTARILGLITRGRVTAARMGTLRPTLQGTMLNGETQQDIALLLPLGMTALPGPGADFVCVRIMGDAAHKVAIGCNDPSLLISDIAAGEIGLRAQGQQFVLRTGSIQVLADGETLRQLVTAAFMDLFNAHTHGGGPPPTQQMTAAHLTGAFQAGGPG